jgi:uncharacterized peroxidase-related enzyme
VARLPIPSLDDLSPDSRGMIEAAEAMMGFVANDALMMSKNPALAEAFGSLVGAIYSPSEIDPGLKRLIGLVTSAASGCQYCVSHTAHTSQHNGIGEEKLAAVWLFESSPLYDDAERAALRVAMHAGQSPNGVTDPMFADLGNYFSEEAQLEIVSVIALFGFLNRWNSTLATDLESLPQAALATITAESSDKS